jgi:hypothetical protein
MVGFPLGRQVAVFPIGEKDLGNVKALVDLFQVSSDAIEVLALNRLSIKSSFPNARQSFPTADHCKNNHQKHRQTQED